MFSRFVKLLDSARGSVSDVLLATLRQLLGNREAVLEHEGKIVLSRGPHSDGSTEDLELNVREGAEERCRGNNLGVFKWAIAVDNWRAVGNPKAAGTPPTEDEQPALTAAAEAALAAVDLQAAHTAVEIAMLALTIVPPDWTTVNAQWAALVQVMGLLQVAAAAVFQAIGEVTTQLEANLRTALDAALGTVDLAMQRVMAAGAGQTVDLAQLLPFLKQAKTVLDAAITTWENPLPQGSPTGTAVTPPETEFWILCQNCDRYGRNGAGSPVDVRLIVTGGNYPDIDIGDIVGYFFDADRVRITFPSFKALHYGYPTPDQDETLVSADQLVLIA